MEYDEFEEVHLKQLQDLGIPSQLWKSLFEKLAHDILDAGLVFEMEFKEEEGWTVSLLPSNSISNHNEDNIYLIDHAWTYQGYEMARTMLEENENLLNRMINLLDINNNNNITEELDVSKFVLSSDIPVIPSNIIENVEEHVIIKESMIPKAGKGAFIDIDIQPGVNLGKYVGEKLTKEEYVRKYPDGKSFYVLSMPGEDNVYVDASDITKSNWTRYINHNEDETNVEWKVGGDVVSTRFIHAHSELYLNYGKQYWKGWNHIAATTGEFDLVGGVDLHDDKVKRSMIEKVIQVLQSKTFSNQFYMVPSVEGEMEKIHYVLDEFGTRIRKGEEPNVKLATFFYLFNGMAYDVMFPLQDIAYQSEIFK